jgi:hypothetical protein
LNNFFKRNGHRSEEMACRVSQFVSGYKRKVSDAKETGEMKLNEGKSPFTFENYHLISEKSLKDLQEPSEVHFAHLYLTLCWNLMARSCSVGHIKYSHITWATDSLQITLPNHKGDKEGASVYPKHVFANPLIPTVCPILALGIHLLCTSFRIQGFSLFYKYYD